MKLKQIPEIAIKLNKKNVIICKTSLIIPLKLSDPGYFNEQIIETIKNGKKHEI
jgi:hypothetical protein